ncbi:hypothetical protein MMC07_000977 [Pseudocyphellaria aurata]|nr:hypothetical protein [Pseudocyphellaria aurata]
MPSTSSSQKRKRSHTGPTTPTTPPPQQPILVSSPPLFISSSVPFSPRPIHLSSPSRRSRAGFQSQLRPSSPIGTLEGAEAVLLASRGYLWADVHYESAPDLVDFDSKAKEQEAFINEDEDENHGQQSARASAPTPTNLEKEKLIQILNGHKSMPKSWTLHRILATPVHHRGDRRLHVDNRLDRLNPEVEDRYRREVQWLCKTPSFGTAAAVDSIHGEVDQRPLDDMVAEANNTAPSRANFILSVGPASRAATGSGQHTSNMKTVAVLAILCRSAHRNNSHYLPLVLALYLYSAGAKVDALTLLNHLGLSVSYDVLPKQLKHIALTSIELIKDQSTNRRLVGTWDNFEYRENVHGERVGDTVKFRSVTMALWIKNGWKISPTGQPNNRLARRKKASTVRLWRQKQEVTKAVGLIASVLCVQSGLSE